MIGIDPFASLISGISAINAIRFGNIEEKALLEEVLEELKSNFKIIKKDYLENKTPIETIIPVIKIDKLEKAEKARKRKKLDFNKIKKGTIDKNCFVNEYQFKYYSNFDIEKALLKLREKVIDIKKAKQIYFKRNKWSSKINQKSRMNTIVYLFVLISKHLSMK